MKKLLLLSLFVFPALASYAQRFEVSEQAGFSITNDLLQKNGFANQVAVEYYPLRYLGISAFYELNNWKSTNKSLGLSVDYAARHFFVGLEAKYGSINPYTDNSDLQDRTRYTYNSTLGCGLHVGAKQKLSKHFSLVEQVGYIWEPVTGYLENLGPSQPSIYVAYNTGFYGIEYRLPGFTEYLYARVGISYRL